MIIYRADQSKRSWVQGPAFWIPPVLLVWSMLGTLASEAFEVTREGLIGWSLLAAFTLYIAYFRYSTPTALILTEDGRLVVERKLGSQEILVSDITRIRALWISWKDNYQIKHKRGSIMILEPIEDFDDLFRRLREANPDFRSG